jgi:hypothetical protein
MKIQKIVGYVLIPVILFLSWYLINAFRVPILEQKRIAQIESQVIEKLKMIRTAEQAYLAVNGKYCGDWAELEKFINEGEFKIVDKKEIDYDSAGKSYSKFIYTDLGTVAVKDSIFPTRNYPNFNAASLKVIPGSGKIFDLFADKIDVSGVVVDVFEAKDVAPENPKRKANKNEKALRVGSRTEVTTSGNWE